MSISGIGAAFSALSLFGTQQTKQAGETPDPFAVEAVDEVKKKPEEEFLDYAKMSIPERIRAQYLEDKGLTEEALAELEVQERKKIEEEIREQIETTIRQETGKTVGGVANMLV